MNLVLQSIKSVFRGVYNAIEASRTHWDTRREETVEYTFDGSLEGKEYSETLQSVKIADDFPDVSSLMKIVLTHNINDNGEWVEETISYDNPNDAVHEIMPGVYIIADITIYFKEDTVWEDGSIVPKGYYFAYMGDTEYVSKLSATYATGELKKLDAKYLPDNLATVEDVEAAKAAAESVQATADNAQATAEEANALANTKMDTPDPVGTGSFSMNRQTGSMVGSYSVAHGYNTVANNAYLFASGKYNKYLSGEYLEQRIEGTVTPYIAGRGTKQYPYGDSYTVDLTTGTITIDSPSYTNGNGFISGVTIGHYVQLSSITNDIYYIGENHGKERDDDYYRYTNVTKIQVKKSALANTYAHVVGNGESDNDRSNAHTLDWDGNAWYAGDVYVGSASGTNKDEGSKKLATEEYVDDAAAGAGGSLIVTITENDDGTFTPSHTSQEIYEAYMGGKSVTLVPEDDSLVFNLQEADDWCAVFDRTGDSKEGIERYVFEIEGNEAYFYSWEHPHRADPMTPATAEADGASGLVPAPEAGQQDMVLHGDGTWREVEGGGWRRLSHWEKEDNIVIQPDAFDVTTGVYTVSSGHGLAGNISVAPYLNGGNPNGYYAQTPAQIFKTAYLSLIVLSDTTFKLQSNGADITYTTSQTVNPGAFRFESAEWMAGYKNIAEVKGLDDYEELLIVTHGQSSGAEIQPYIMPTAGLFHELSWNDAWRPVPYTNANGDTYGNKMDALGKSDIIYAMSVYINNVAGYSMHRGYSMSFNGSGNGARKTVEHINIFGKVTAAKIMYINSLANGTVFDVYAR